MIHKIRSRQLLALLAEAQQPPINVVEYSPLRPHHLGALHADGSLRLWDVDRSTKIAKLGGGRATTDLLGLAFSPVNAKFLAAARVDGAVAFWDADRGVCVKALDVGGRCTSLAFATERVVVVGADDGRLVAYDLRSTAAPVSHVDAHDGAVRSLQFVDAAPPRPRIAASPQRAATPPRQATPKATPPRSPVASPRRVVAPPPLPAVEPEAPPPPPSPARLYREKQQNSPDKAPAAVSPAPAPPAFYEALDDVADELRASVQNLHVDVLRQFQIQKSEVAALLEAHESRIAELLRENAGLRRENEELRLPW